MSHPPMPPFPQSFGRDLLVRRLGAVAFRQQALEADDRYALVHEQPRREPDPLALLGGAEQRPLEGVWRLAPIRAAA